MIKLIAIALLLVSGTLTTSFNLSNKNETIVRNNSIFIIEDKTIQGVKEEYLDSDFLRIYDDSDNPVISVSDHAFDDCSNLKYLMLSNATKNISFTILDSLENIYYTGSEEEFIASFPTYSGLSITEFACDEGFIHYWNDYVRNDEHPSICDIPSDVYKNVTSLYYQLEETDDLEYVADLKDPKDDNFTISQSMKEMKKYQTQETQKTTRKINRSSMLTLILIISFLGMTSICVFYLLKDKNIIQ